MARLPKVGGDNGNWGDILNDYLSQELNEDGSLKIRTDGTLFSGIADGSISASKLSSTVNNYLASAQTAVQTVNGKSGQSVTLSASDVSAVAVSAVGSASGIATLDSSSKLTPGQLPSSVASRSEAPISVKDPDYGAIGDGVTNDAPAIQAAIAAAGAQGRDVLLPAGTYVVASRITLASGVSLRGEGRAVTTIRATTGVTTAVLVGLSGSAVTDLEITGLTVDADYTTSGLSLQGVQVTNGVRVAIRDCAITNVAKAGVLFTTCTDCELSRSRVSYTGQEQASVGFGVLLSGGSGCAVRHNHFYACNGMGIGGNSNALKALIDGNVCDASATPRTTVNGAGQDPASTGTLTVTSTAGFPADGTLSIEGIVGAVTYTGKTATTFTGCAGAAGTATNGGVARNGYEGIGFTSGCENWQVVTNRVIDSGDNGISASADKCMVQGNVVLGSQFHGILLLGGSHSSVIGNWILNPGTVASGQYSGLRVTDGSNSIVALNRFYDDRGASNKMRSGIRELNNSTNMTYFGNRITGATSVEYELTTSATTQRLLIKAQTAVTVSGAGTVATDAATTELRTITVSTASGFTMGAPTNPHANAILVYNFLNSSGSSMGTVTWNSAFKLAGSFTNPGNGARRTITFRYDGTNWIEQGRTAADIT